MSPLPALLGRCQDFSKERRRSGADVSYGQSEGTAIIFDWDDTLMPTQYITETVWPSHRRGHVLQASPSYQVLAAHAKAVEQVLLTARRCGKVAILTLAKRPWVQQSAKWYLPGLDFESLLQRLEIPVFYAREHVTGRERALAAAEPGVDIQVIAKRKAMEKCLKHILGRTVMNVISIGDSTVEYEALKDLVWAAPSQPLCKTVMLLEAPQVEELTDELFRLADCMDAMVTYADDFDLSFDFVSDEIRSKHCAQ